MALSTSQVTGAGRVSVRRGRYRIYALLFLLSVVSYIDRISISVGAKSIAQEFHLSPVAMGYLLSAFFWSYALCLIPVGMLGRPVGRAENHRRLYRVVVGDDRSGRLRVEPDRASALPAWPRGRRVGRVPRRRPGVT